VADTKLTVLVDSGPGALAVSKTLADANQQPHIRVVDECGRAAANAENLLVFAAASKLDHVAECVSIANKAHRLAALLVYNDVAANWLPYVFHRSGLRTLRNMIVHTDPELPARILNAWAIGGEHDFIVDAAVIKDRLVVRSCAFEEYSVSFEAFPTLRLIPDSARANFVLEENGLLLHWRDFQVHLDLDDIRFASDPKRQQAAKLERIGDQRAIGAALKHLREGAGLKQSDIRGISERQVRRVESGDRLTLDTLDAFAMAMNVESESLLERLSEAVAEGTAHRESVHPPRSANDTAVIGENDPLRNTIWSHEQNVRRFARTGEGLKLAADSSEEPTARHWTLDAPNGGSIRGLLEHDFRKDELVFLINEARDLETESKQLSMIAWSSQVAEPLISQPFVPQVGARVSLAIGRGIVPRDVSKIELRAVSE